MLAGVTWATRNVAFHVSGADGNDETIICPLATVENSWPPPMTILPAGHTARTVSVPPPPTVIGHRHGWRKDDLVAADAGDTLRASRALEPHGTLDAVGALRTCNALGALRSCGTNLALRTSGADITLQSCVSLRTRCAGCSNRAGVSLGSRGTSFSRHALNALGALGALEALETLWSSLSLRSHRAGRSSHASRSSRASQPSRSNRAGVALGCQPRRCHPSARQDQSHPAVPSRRPVQPRQSRPPVRPRLYRPSVRPTRSHPAVPLRRQAQPRRCRPSVRKRREDR